jgi:hypothetical protein
MNLFNWLRSSPNGENRRAGAHMTWAKTSVGRTISRTGLFLRKQLWVWPIIAVVLLAVIGYAVSRSIHQTMEASLRSELQTLLTVERSMLVKWFKVQESAALTLANNRGIRETVTQLLASAAGSAQPGGSATPAAEVDPAALQGRLAKELEPGMSAHEFVGYMLTDKQYRIVAATATELIGQSVPQYEEFLARTLEGKPTVSVPYPSVGVLEDETGRARTGAPTMWVSAPVRDDNLQVVAVLALRIRPEKEFTDILQLGRIGDTGETYAVNKDGLMVSNSRFDEALILLGLLPDDDSAASILNILVRNPGGNMVEGFRPSVRRRELPLTEICAAVVSGASGIMMEPYRDYRGSPSVGAYAWLPDYQIGLITEIDTGEAFRPLTILRRTFWGLFALLALSAAAIFVFTILLARSRREAQKSAIEAQQIGQYKLDRKLGAGGMGVVYMAHHAMLRRPTAVKMLEPDKVNEGTIERFEREVQITSQLNNPNTVAIYDYGRTPEGVFYYAMEFLDGIDLQSLVERYGPQPVPRVIHILQQICGSLYEAHSLGLVHRDIKPANIMLNRRGGQPDVVKVLDFGLVKALDDQRQAGLTQQASLTGTPLYMSPEAIQMPNSVDARSDIYAVGAVGYFLLTGQPVFEADNVVDLCQKHVATPPIPPSERSRTPIPAELENALLACLEKSRAKRPQTARDLALLIARCPEATQWSIEDADAWWGRHERGQASGIRPVPVATGSTASRGNDMTIDLKRG